jgi:hypothetical protein
MTTPKPPLPPLADVPDSVTALRELYPHQLALAPTPAEQERAARLLVRCPVPSAVFHPYAVGMLLGNIRAGASHGLLCALADELDRKMYAAGEL